LGMCAQVIAKDKLVGDVVMTGGVGMDVMRSPVRTVLAEVETTRYSGNDSVETLASNSVAQSLHGRAEAVDRFCFPQHDENVDRWFDLETRNGSASGVMHLEER